MMGTAVRPFHRCPLETSTMSTGKWAQKKVPHKGWTWVDVEDLGAPSETCEMCEVQEIRYVHLMEHPNHPDTLRVGCVCAEKMADDYVRPRERERVLRSQSARRDRWLARSWRTSRAGNAWLRADGFRVSIFLKRDGTWGGSVTDEEFERQTYWLRSYRTEAAAKLAAFDAMVALKAQRPYL